MLLPLDEVPVHVHRFAARAPCDSKGSGCPGVSVESIQPRRPRPCEVGRPKGRRRKSRCQSHNFFLAPAAPGLAIRPEREYVVAHRPFLSFMDRPTVTSRPARLWREGLLGLNTTTRRRDGGIGVYCSGAPVPVAEATSLCFFVVELFEKTTQ